MILRSDQGRIQISVSSITLPDSSSWSYLSGGDPSISTEHVYPGGMAEQIVLGGLATRADITVRRPFSDSWINTLYKLDNSIQKSLSASVTFTPLENQTTTAGPSRTWTGVLKEVKYPGVDAATSTVTNIELTISLNQSATTGS